MQSHFSMEHLESSHSSKIKFQAPSSVIFTSRSMWSLSDLPSVYWTVHKKSIRHCEISTLDWTQFWYTDIVMKKDLTGWWSIHTSHMSAVVNIDAVITPDIVPVGLVHVRQDYSHTLIVELVRALRKVEWHLDYLNVNRFNQECNEFIRPLKSGCFGWEWKMQRSLHRIRK